MSDKVRVAMVGDDRRQSVDQSKLPVGTCRNAAVTIFLQMLGEENGTSLSLSVAGMADPVLASRVASTVDRDNTLALLGKLRIIGACTCLPHGAIPLSMCCEHDVQRGCGCRGDLFDRRDVSVPVDACRHHNESGDRMALSHSGRRISGGASDCMS
jgi:hypothetical protein